MSNNKLQPVRGTKDLFGSEIAKYNHIISTALNLAKNFGFEELQTPIFEFSEIFEKNLGDDSDIVTKEVYKFLDRSNNSITLRPEFTASIVRALISNGEFLQKLPKKFFSFGPIFRYDRPQKGRQRQFNQINFELFGEDDVCSDLEILILSQNILKNLNILNNVQLNINSIGCQITKKNYENALKNYFEKYKNDLSADSQNRLIKNSLRILDSKDENDIKLIKDAPIIASFYSKESQERFDKLINYLEKFSIKYLVNYHLVRGLDYYTSLVFEYVMESEGAQNAVLAGGRYDDLVYKMSNEKVPAIGFAGGIERLMLLINDIDNSKRPIFVNYISENEKIYAFEVANKLRLAGFYVEFIFDGNFKKQMKKSSILNARYVIIIGENELNNKEVVVKDFDNSNEFKVKQDLLIHYMRGKL
jgi:histidyl-tRNA synthetase